MRVCLITDEFPPQIGGVGDFVYRLAQELAGRGVQVTVLAPVGSVADPRQPFQVQQVWKDHSAEEMKQAFRFLRSGSFDAIHVHYCSNAFHWKHPGFVALLAALRFSTKAALVVTFHELADPYTRSFSGVIRPTIHRVRVAGVLALAHQRIVTTLGRERLLKRFLSPETVHCIEIPSALPEMHLTPELRKKTRAEWGFTAQDIVVSSFGMIEPGKGFDLILQAASLLRKEGRELKLLWIGAEVDASYQSHLQKAKVASGMQGLVIQTGHLESSQAAALIAASDVYAMLYSDGVCTRRSSFPAGLQQSIASLTTVGPDTPPYLVDGVNIRMVPRHDLSALYQALRELAVFPQLRQRLAEQGHQTYKEHFSPQSVIQATLAVYERTLRQR